MPVDAPHHCVFVEEKCLGMVCFSDKIAIFAVANAEVKHTE
jgi:hypothetical protein